MEFRKHECVRNGRTEWYNIVPLGDIHLGNIGCDLAAFKSMIEWIKNKEDTLWVGMGDYIDAINYSDPRFDPKTVSPKYISGGDIDKTIQLQIEDLCGLLEPIKDKCIGILRGNHEETIRRFYHYDVLYEIAKELDFKRDMLLYDTAVVRLHFTRAQTNRRVFDIFCAHGNVGGRTYGAKSNRIRELHNQFVADIYLLAHSHIKQAQIGTVIGFDHRGNEYKKKIIDAFTGCFLRGYERGQTSYIEKCLYPATDIGAVRLMIQPETGDKHVSL